MNRMIIQDLIRRSSCLTKKPYAVQLLAFQQTWFEFLVHGTDNCNIKDQFNLVANLILIYNSYTIHNIIHIQLQI